MKQWKNWPVAALLCLSSGWAAADLYDPHAHLQLQLPGVNDFVDSYTTGLNETRTNILSQVIGQVSVHNDNSVTVFSSAYSESGSGAAGVSSQYTYYFKVDAPNAVSGTMATVSYADLLSLPQQSVFDPGGGLAWWRDHLLFDINGQVQNSVTIQKDQASDLAHLGGNSGQLSVRTNEWQRVYIDVNASASFQWWVSAGSSAWYSGQVDARIDFDNLAWQVDHPTMGNATLVFSNVAADASGPSAVPEPGTLLLVGVGVAGLMGARRVRRNKLVA